MSVINFCEQEHSVYVIMGIDANGHDQVIAVSQTYEQAKKYCIKFLMETEFYDLWMEKHELL